MLGDVNGRCPEDDFVPAWIRLPQPLEVLRHRPVSRHHHLSASREISINLGQPTASSGQFASPDLRQACIRLVRPNAQTVETGGPYGQGAFIRQAGAPEAAFNGRYPVLGLWMIDQEPASLA